MSEYSPPLDDMKFTLKEVVNVNSLSELPAFSEVGLEALDSLLDEASRFFNEVISPTNRTGDLEGSLLNDDGSVSTPSGFREAYAQYVDAGWGAISFDPEYGGGGFPWLVGIPVTEMLTAANMALSLNPMLTQGSILALSAHGNQEQKLAWLPKLITGEWAGTMNLTEPQAGSDVGALTTKAELQDDGTYKITPKNDTSNLGLTDYSNLASNSNMKMNFNPNTFDNIEPENSSFDFSQYNDDEKKKKVIMITKTNTVIT